MTNAPVTPLRILDLARGFMASKVLLSAAELGLFSVLAESGPLDGETLRKRLGLQERGVCDFFDALVALGLLERDEAGRYANTAETSLYLDQSKESYLGGFLSMLNTRHYVFWGRLVDGLRTGQPQNEVRDGTDFFGGLYSDAARLRAFLRGMSGLSLLTAKAIVAKFPWRDYRTMIDVGTAQGCLPVQVAKAYPHLTGGGFDLPIVQPVFEEYVQEHGLSDRLRFHPGDFFRDPLPTADVLVMGHIPHDWNLSEKLELMRKAYEALPSGGALLAYDMIIDDDRRKNTHGLLLSLTMLLETHGGFDYTGADCVGWMRSVGFREARIEHLAGPHSMAIALK